MPNPEIRPALKQLLDDALSSSEFAWWEWDIQDNRVIFNDLKATMLGYNPDDFRDQGYQAFTDLLHPNDYERTMQAMRDHLEGRAPIYQVDYRIRRADGTYTWYMDRGSTIEKDSKGKPKKLRGIVVDLGDHLREKTKDRALFKLIRRTLPLPGVNEGIAVLCSACKKIKISESVWMPVDSSFEKALLEDISFGICLDCIRLLYPEEADEFL
jgi:PAS domain S-box-containing protein